MNTKYGRSSVGLALPYCELAVKAVLQNIPTTLHNFHEEKTKEEWFLLSDDKKYRLLLETLPNRIACQVATFRYRFVSVFYFWIFVLYLYLPNRISCQVATFWYRFVSVFNFGYLNCFCICICQTEFLEFVFYFLTYLYCFCLYICQTGFLAKWHLINLNLLFDFFCASLCIYMMGQMSY